MSSDRTSNISPISNQTAREGTPDNSNQSSSKINDYASEVLNAILDRNPILTVIIADASNGRALTSTLNKREACENLANILQFTDKCKVLVRKLLDEDLEFVRIKGTGKEIVVTFDEDLLEIVTIQSDDESMK